jgi:cobalt-zinc-cadmium efflux system protein
LTLQIPAAHIIGGELSHSLALLSNARHALTDLFTLGPAWFAAAQKEVIKILQYVA